MHGSIVPPCAARAQTPWGSVLTPAGKRLALHAHPVDLWGMTSDPAAESAWLPARPDSPVGTPACAHPATGRPASRGVACSGRCGRPRTPGVTPWPRCGPSYVTGRLQTDTFDLRVEHALTADSRGELRSCSPPTSRTRRWRDRMRALRPPARRRQLARRPRAAAAPRSFTARGARPIELVFCDDTVSRHHARLELCATAAGTWSTSTPATAGTLVNGRRVHDAEVRAGDRIRLGAAGFTL